MLAALRKHQANSTATINGGLHPIPFRVFIFQVNQHVVVGQESHRSFCFDELRSSVVVVAVTSLLRYGQLRVLCALRVRSVFVR